MKRLDSLFGTSHIETSSLENHGTNFFIVGTDGKNPWRIQSHKLTAMQVKSVAESGVEILATPHIGNHWSSNSMYPNMGVKICDFTGNQSFIDYADEPQSIKEGHSKHQCSVENHAILSPYLQLNKGALLSNGYISAKEFSECSNLAYVHHQAKRKALGEHNIMLDVDLFDQPFISSFFEVLVKNEKEILCGYQGNRGREGIFDRFVSRSGIIKRCSPGKISDVQSFLEMKRLHREMILQDCILEAEGFVPINEVMILLNSISCYFKQVEQSIHYFNIGDTYTVSGIDMLNYTRNDSFRSVLDRMYKALLKSDSFNWLPEYMVHTIIPGGVFRFLPANTEIVLEESVIELLNLHDERKEFSKRFGGVSGSEHEFLLSEYKTKVNFPFKIAREHFKDATNMRRGFTQYDLLNGEYVSQDIIERLMKVSFEEIATLFKTD